MVNTCSAAKLANRLRPRSRAPKQRAPENKIKNTDKAKDIERLLIFQPALPSYRLDFFARVARNLGDSFHLYYSPEDMGALTGTGSTPEWAQTIGPIHRPLPGVEWQEGALSIPLRRTDIVVVSGAPRCLSNLVLILKARLRGAKTIWWGHYWSSSSRPYRFFIRMMLMKLAHAVLFYTDAEVEEYLRGLGASDRRQISALNNGINIDPILPLREPYDATSRERAGLFIGRITDKAELDVLLEGMSDPRLEGFRLHIVGDGPGRERLQGRASALGVEQNIVWHGAHVDEPSIATIANRCRIFIYPGSVGLSLIHAMAYGLPAVVHDDRRLHMPEIAAFSDGETGSTFQRGNAQSLSKAIMSLVNDDDMLYYQSTNSTKIVENHYNTENMNRIMLDFVIQIAAYNHSGAGASPLRQS